VGLRENVANKLKVLKRKITRKILVQQKQMMATGGLKVIKK